MLRIFIKIIMTTFPGLAIIGIEIRRYYFGSHLSKISFLGQHMANKEGGDNSLSFANCHSCPCLRRDKSQQSLPRTWYGESGIFSFFELLSSWIPAFTKMTAMVGCFGQHLQRKATWFRIRTKPVQKAFNFKRLLVIRIDFSDYFGQ